MIPYYSILFSQKGTENLMANREYENEWFLKLPGTTVIQKIVSLFVIEQLNPMKRGKNNPFSLKDIKSGWLGY